MIAVDWDLPEFDHSFICGAARHLAPVGILALTAQPERAPAALKAGCHALLLKPVTLNRTWPEVQCPHCSEGNAVCFEYSSHRRSWYACLKCEHAWLGPRRE